MEIGEILDRAKSANGIKTDMALADALGVGRAAVSAWRHGQRLPDPVQCATLAGLSGMPLAQVMGIVGEARAISREEKAVWRKLAGSVALLLCAIGFSGATPGKAYAVSVSESGHRSAAEECLLCQRSTGAGGGSAEIRVICMHRTLKTL